MATRKSTAAMNTGKIPLDFAKAVSAAANAAWKDGSFAEAVTPVARELLKHWFMEPFTNRPLNFHEGQRQAILNAIYLHEVVGAANPADAYAKVAPSLLSMDGGAVEKFVKVNEAKHVFARIAYLRSDGLLGEYIPDFLVATKARMYLVETKAEKDKSDSNVQAKRRAALEWCKTINGLPSEDRDGHEWAYLLLTDRDFYAYRSANATFADFAAFAELTESALKGEFSF